MITRDLLKYPDQFVSVLNDALREIQILKTRLDKLEKEKK